MNALNARRGSKAVAATRHGRPWLTPVAARDRSSVLSVYGPVDGVRIAPIEPALTCSFGVTGVFWEGPVDIGARSRTHIVSGTEIARLTLTVGASSFETSPED